jgi:predicted small lipoprotein YifL
MTRLAFLLVVLATLSACGNKGPLVLPDAAAPPPVAQPEAIDPAQPPVGTESDSEAPIPR